MLLNAMCLDERLHCGITSFSGRLEWLKMGFILSTDSFFRANWRLEAMFGTSM